MDTDITHFRSSKAIHLIPEAGSDPYAVWAPRVFLCGQRPPQGDSYLHGVRFHALLRRIGDNHRLTSSERAYLPYLEAIRQELRGHGVRFISPEVRLRGDEQFDAGRCDMALTGGLSEVGVNEVKCVGQVPNQPRPEDLHQLGRYASMVSRDTEYAAVWGCVSYVSVPGRVVRIFAYQDATQLHRSENLAVAA